MTQTIESFVEKLQADGVEAGKKVAEQLVNDARQQAEQIVADAKAQAEQLIQQANDEAATIAQRERHGMDLAARDTMLKLRDGVSKAIGALLAQQTEQVLSDTNFLAELIRDVVMQYAKADAYQEKQILININPNAAETIANWALQYLSESQRADARAHIDLHTTLKSLGFEYRVSESTVEVTPESIVAVLNEQISPALREVLDRVMDQAAG